MQFDDNRFQTSIWDNPALDLTRFNTAQLYIHNQNEQMLAPNHPDHHGYTPIQEDELSCNAVNSIDAELEQHDDKLVQAWVDHSKKRFLDTVAKIFAYESPLQKKHYRMLGEHETSSGNTADHVTAAGLEYDTEEGLYRVILAKNRGFDNEDESFAKRLFIWMNDCVTNGQETYSIWDDLVRFTEKRIKWYLVMLMNKEKSVKSKNLSFDGKTETISQWIDCERTIKSHLQSKGLLDDSHSETFSRIQRLFELCREYSQIQSKPNEKSSVNWSTVKASSKSSLSKLKDIIQYAFDSRKLIHGLCSQLCVFQNSLDDDTKVYMAKLVSEVDFLCRPKVQIDVLLDITQLKQIHRFEYELLPEPSFQKPDPGALRLALEALPEGSKAMATRAKLLSKFRKNPSAFDAKFHCEMQLLLFFDKPEHNLQRYPYFGVSKKSCWQCATILAKHGMFSTSGTHGRISGPWAVDSKQPSEALTQAVKYLHDEILKLQAVFSMSDKVARAKEITIEIQDRLKSTDVNLTAAITKLLQEQQSCLDWDIPKLPRIVQSTAGHSASVRRRYFDFLEYAPSHGASGISKKQPHVQGRIHLWRNDLFTPSEATEPIEQSVADDESAELSLQLSELQSSNSAQLSSSISSIQPSNSPVHQNNAVALRPYVPGYLRQLELVAPRLTLHSKNKFSMDFTQYMQSLDVRNFLPKPHDMDDESKSVLSASINVHGLMLTNELGISNYRQYFLPLLKAELIENRRDNDRHSQYNVILHQDLQLQQMLLLNVPGLREGNPYLEPGDVVCFRPLQAGQRGLFLPADWWRRSTHDAELEIVQSDHGFGLTLKTYVYQVLRDRDKIRLYEPSLSLNMRSFNNNIPTPFNVTFPVQERKYRSMLLVLHVLEDELRKIQALEKETRTPWLRSMLFPRETDGVISLHQDIFPRQWKDPDLNEEQQKAVNDICERNYGQVPFLISGPPGTGKTKTLVELALQLIDGGNNNEHVLICAPSDSAADSIAERLVRSKLSPNTLLRLNPPWRLSSEMKSALISHSCMDQETGMFTMPSFEDIMQKRVVVTTCQAASLLVESRLTNADLYHLERGYAKVIHHSPSEATRLHWTALLFDESTQAIEPEAVIPLVVVAVPTIPDDISVKPLVVFAGDEHQLGPQTFSNDARLKNSMFTRLLRRPLYSHHPESRTKVYSVLMGAKRKRAPFANLNRNYRSHAAILAIPSHMNYGDTLLAEAKPSDNILQLPIWRGRKWPVLFVPNLQDDKFTGITSGTWNDAEVSIAVRFVREILQSGKGVQQHEIGIMSPFQTNVRNIRQAMRNLDLFSVDVGPCDAFQGLEKRIVILCTTRSSQAHLTTDIALGKGVIQQPNRMNVCLTRAQQGLIVIGHPKTLRTDPKWASWLDYCERNGLVSGPASQSLNLDMTPKKLDSLPLLERYLLSQEFPQL
jgi:helicase MOV-10